MKVYLVSMTYPNKNLILGTFTNEEKAKRFFKLKKSSLPDDCIYLTELECNDEDRLLHESILYLYEDGSTESMFSDYILGKEPRESEIEFFHEQCELNAQEETGLFAIASISTVSRSNNVRIDKEQLITQWEEDGGWR